MTARMHQVHQAQRDPRGVSWHWEDPSFDDLAVEAKVISLVAKGKATWPLWRWPVRDHWYNGASPQRRIIGWQKVWLACRLELIPYPRTCSICLSTDHAQYHNENYFRPLQAKPICPGCHRKLHRRFHDPEPWSALIALHSENYPGAWFADLPMVPSAVNGTRSSAPSWGS